MQEKDFKALLDKHKAGIISDAEKTVLDSWYLQVAVDASNELSDENRLETFNHVLANLNEVIYGKRRSLWPRLQQLRQFCWL